MKPILFFCLTVTLVLSLFTALKIPTRAKVQIKVPINWSLLVLSYLHPHVTGSSVCILHLLLISYSLLLNENKEGDMGPTFNPRPGLNVLRSYCLVPNSFLNYRKQARKMSAGIWISGLINNSK